MSRNGTAITAGRRRPLNCLFVITSLPVGGAETLLVNLMRRMDPDRVRPAVVCLKEPGPLAEEIAGEFPLESELLAGKWDLRVLPRLIRLFRRRQADAVITIGAGDKMFWGRLAAKLAGVPVIASALHSTGWPDGVGRMNRWLTPITDAFIAVAQSHGKHLREFERFPADKVWVIRNGVDCDRFRPDHSARTGVREELGLPPETPLVGIVAALRPEKNHAMLVRAAERLRDRLPAAHWVLVGDGPEREKIQRLAADTGTTDRLHLLGTRQDTPRLLAALDLFTLCSLNEAFPVSILEALACEVPVVATDVGSVNESIVDGETGWLVAVNDLDQYVDRIARLLGDPAARNRMGTAGRDRVIRYGSLDAMVEGYQRLVTELYRTRSREGAAAVGRAAPLRGHQVGEPA